MEKYMSATDMLRRRCPERPVLALRPHAAEKAAHWFLAHFPGRILYAVKANDNPLILDALYRAGIRDFDVSSLEEITHMPAYEDITLHIMNPVKSRETIARAYFDYGVRAFALDSQNELEKILKETGHAKNLVLFVRIASDCRGSRIALDQKFGIALHEASDLLLNTRHAALRLGVTFHIGSQAMEPERYSETLKQIDRLIIESGTLLDIIDIGGGFPSIYPGLKPPPLDHYIAAITHQFEQTNVVETCELICEPGRALVAEAGSVITRVEHRRDNTLYLNEGAFGTLFDAAHHGFVYPVSHIYTKPRPLAKIEPFSFFGPTCDSADYMPGPFYLPGCIGEGDYLEIGQLGAYGQVLSTRFNGFGRYDEAILLDAPMMSMYAGMPNEMDLPIGLPGQAR